MKVEVSNAIEELKRQFAGSSLTVREDGQGGAYVVMESVELGPKFRPSATWVGFQIPAQYPYADIYPVFIGGNVVRADGAAYQAPVTPGHTFEGRAALQISRRSAAAQSGSQKASAKILKVLDFLERLQ
jgi:hypothetical protein